MAYGSRTALMLLIAWLVTACSPGASQLESIAVRLSDAANRCVVDVQERGVKYESSENCRSLGRIAHEYISAGGSRTAPHPVPTVLPKAQEQELGWRSPFRKPAIRA
jgi:hypothetical protein